MKGLELMKKIILILIVVMVMIMALGCDMIRDLEIEVDPEPGEQPIIVETEVIAKVLKAESTTIETMLLDGTDMLANIHTGDAEWADGVDREIAEGNIITVITDGTVAESYPVQMWALKIIGNEPDEIISLDPNEEISGIIGGEYPTVLLDENKMEAEVDIDAAFAIKMIDAEIEVELSDEEAIIPTGDGIIDPYHYWGYKIIKKGEFYITLKFKTKDGTIDTTFQIFAGTSGGD